MSSSSSPASSASSTSAAPPASFSVPGPPGAVPRPHASSESLRISSAGAGSDKRSERRRSTLSGSDRKRRLVNFEGDGWPHRAGSHGMMEAGSSSRIAVDSRSIQGASSHAVATPAVPGSSFATPIDLSSSPPQPLSERPDNTHRTSWSQGANGYMEYIRPRWQPDSEVTNCPICGTPFSFWYRKHHCRKCGRVVCASCSPHRITIPRQFIVRPPEPNRSPASTLIPARAAQVINLDGDDTAPPPAAINPALGGGEEVRLCNPCVPDPNPEPLRGYTAVRGGGEQGTNWGRGPPTQARHRSYHSMSTSTRQFPYDAFTESSSRLNRRSISSNDYTSLGSALGGVFGSSLQERPTRYGSLSSSQYSNRHSSSARPYLGYFPSHRPLPPLAPEGTSVSTGGFFSTTSDEQEFHRRVSRPSRRHVDESDICPICNDELPPLGENGNEDAREAHIRDCIEGHGHGARSASRGGSPVGASPVPVRMLAFTATEKDCLGQDGAVQECTICMEDYEVGQPLSRHLLALAAPQAMDIDPRLRVGRDKNGPEGAQTGHSYVPSTASRQVESTATTAPSTTHPAGDYPDPPSSHFSPSEQVHSASSASGSHSHYAASNTQSTSPHGYYPSGPVPGTESTDPNDPYGDPKRPRACEACRQLKVRCEPDPSNPNGSCKRCAKAGRTCVVTAPTRKRQKKTDSRVAELERKIDALTASLQASQGHELLLQTRPTGEPREEHQGRRWLGGGQTAPNGPTYLSPPVDLAGSKRHSSGEVKDSRDPGPTAVYPRVSSPLKEQTRENAPSRQWRGPWSSSESGSRPDAGTSEFVDVIDRGLVSLPVALEAFNRFVTHMGPQMPFVVFPPGTTMSDVRKSKPVLLHAIIAVSVGAIQPDAHLALLEDFYKTIAERIVVKGEKSLELVQALVVSCHWYTPPDQFEQLKFYQLTHMAVTVAMDLGMNRRLLTRNKPLPMFKEMAMKKPPSMNPDSPETRRTWLACYFMAVQVAVSLRRVLLVRWQPYMDECVAILEKSPDALPSDKAVIQWAKLARMTEDINFQLSSDDAVSNVPFTDPKVQYTVKVFEKQLEQWKRETPPEIYNPIMKQSEYIVNLYIYENSMLMETGDDRKKTGEDYTNAAHMHALSVCLTSIHQVLDTICSVDIKDLISLPTVCLARASFAAVSLIKLYSIVSSPGSQIGQVIDPSSLKVEYYLNEVIDHYAAAGELPGGRTPGKFSVVLAMLRSWFVKRKDHNRALREAFGAGPVACTPVDFSEAQEGDKPQSGQTPLQLLSEVAMKDPNSRSATNHHRPSYASQSSAEPISQTPTSDLTAQTVPSSTTTDSDPWTQYPSVPLSSATTQAQQQAQTRQFYSPFNSNYQDMSSYPDGGNMMMPPMNQGFFVPELGMQVGFDSGNIFALEHLLTDGLLNLPLPTDGGMGYY
ncbi:putative C6 transcription factor (War1) [Aspergillus thermomutatus]|uniref:Zn(2)-C6 fungal-type domain-containing protein n=1 Tax=Aspergillus thermomutatus TaxID=41047 RepID=A0A397H204_ASPTH|nr:uncharacterized protein CDV56_103259 [Aspergillus thermomutatus]RHZ54400.1 hypothetical protein CDV56_103259 [Aspergillus thermomutatus]